MTEHLDKESLMWCPLFFLFLSIFVHIVLIFFQKVWTNMDKKNRDVPPLDYMNNVHRAALGIPTGGIK